MKYGHIISGYIITAIIIATAQTGCAQDLSILGQWVTIDDKNGNEVSIVEFYKKGDKINGKVVKLLPKAKTTHCNACPGDKKGKSLINMDLIWDLEPNGEIWDNGTILDPRGGRTYQCLAWLGEEPNTLKVRGCVGISLLGKTQTWKRYQGEKFTP